MGLQLNTTDEGTEEATPSIGDAKETSVDAAVAEVLSEVDHIFTEQRTAL